MKTPPIDRNEVERLAVVFSSTYNSPDLLHCSTWNLIAEVGGAAAINYGRYLEIPIRMRWKKSDVARRVADALRAYLKT